MSLTSFWNKSPFHTLKVKKYQFNVQISTYKYLQDRRKMVLRDTNIRVKSCPETWIDRLEVMTLSWLYISTGWKHPISTGLPSVGPFISTIKTGASRVRRCGVHLSVSVKSSLQRLVSSIFPEEPRWPAPSLSAEMRVPPHCMQRNFIPPLEILKHTADTDALKRKEDILCQLS